ncbi:MAG TPA: response regulator [Verrucomicrobiae bacterium]|nr:response regulator [Verrucomicrobiae bacterium]
MGKAGGEGIWQDRFRLLAENVTDHAMFLLDASGRVVEWNIGAKRLLGYSLEEILHQHFAVFFPPEERKAGKPKAELRVAKQRGRSECEGWRVRKDGSRFWAREIVTPIRASSGKLTGFAKITRDLTERREAEDALRMMNESLERRVRERTSALESYQRELKSLALQLSRTEVQERHRLAADLHSNLAQLLALCQIKLASLDTFSTRDKADKVLESVRDYVERAIRYTRSLMSRLSPPVQKRKHLGWAIKAVVDEMRTYGLQVELEDDCKRKPVDPEVLGLLYQGVRELLFNVLKHSHSNRAKIVLRCVSDVVEVHVRDFGIGFPRTSRTRKRLFGFGLLHLRERLALLGGRLEILPHGPKGTHILLAVPRKNLRLHSGDAGLFRNRARTAEAPIRVLIVDDNELMREGLRKVLGEQQDLHVVGEASNGELAVSLARRLKPDVVLMDVNMPGMDGIEATRRIHRQVRSTCVIGFSIHEDKYTAEAIKRAGASAYVTKQENPDKLYEVIRHHSRARAQ